MLKFPKQMENPPKKLQKALPLGNIIISKRISEKMPQNILWAKEVVVERSLVQALATMSL